MTAHVTGCKQNPEHEGILPRLTPSAFARMAKYTSIDESGCHLWTGPKNDMGYGKLYLAGKEKYAHRIAWTIEAGEEIPAGMVLDHLCRTPACVNPAHLDVVTQGTNVRRGAWAQRTHCVHGHEFTPENTFRCRKGWRRCRTCARAGWKRARERRQTA